MMKRQAEKEQGSTSSRSKRTGIPELVDETATSLYDDVVAIVEAKFELLKIELAGQVSVLATAAALGVILMVGAGYFVTTLALLAGELLGHPFLGYLFVSLIFLSCFVFFAKFKPLLLKNMLQNIFLSVNDYKK